MNIYQNLSINSLRLLYCWVVAIGVPAVAFRPVCTTRGNAYSASRTTSEAQLGQTMIRATHIDHRCGCSGLFRRRYDRALHTCDPTSRQQQHKQQHEEYWRIFWVPRQGIIILRAGLQSTWEKNSWKLWTDRNTICGQLYVGFASDVDYPSDTIELCGWCVCGYQGC